MLTLAMVSLAFTNQYAGVNYNRKTALPKIPVEQHTNDKCQTKESAAAMHNAFYWLQ